jgi:hypothetical protein
VFIPICINLNQMIERPFDHIRDIFRENNEKGKKLLEFVFEKSDNISLWIIGLSIGAISIFANDISKVKEAVPYHLSIILYLLAFSVTTGIFYRLSYLYFFVINNYVANIIDLRLSTKKAMDTTSYLTGNETYPELVQVVKNGFDEDYTELITLYNNSDDIGKKILYDSMVTHYLKGTEFAKKDTELALNFVASLYAECTGTTKEKWLKKAERDNIGAKYKWSLRIIGFLFICYIVSFLAALFLFAASIK